MKFAKFKYSVGIDTRNKYRNILQFSYNTATIPQILLRNTYLGDVWDIWEMFRQKLGSKCHNYPVFYFITWKEFRKCC